MTSSNEHVNSDETLGVAAAQFCATTDIATNLRRIKELSASAAERGARVVIFPEAAMYAWDVSGDALSAAAHAHYLPFVDGLADIARAFGVTLIAGAFAPAPSARPYNRILVIGPDGTSHCSYDKVHLYDAFAYRESDKVSAGQTYDDLSELCTISIGSFTLGLLNCYDLRFPEMARALVDRGANALVVSAAWVAGPNKELHWETLLRARAIENTCYVLGSSQSPPASSGLSMIVDPTGLVAATCVTTEGLALHRLDPAHLRAVRETAPTLAHRRYTVVASSDVVKTTPCAFTHGEPKLISKPLR